MFEKNEQKQTPQSELRYKADETLQKTNDIKNGVLVGTYRIILRRRKNKHPIRKKEIFVIRF